MTAAANKKTPGNLPARGPGRPKGSPNKVGVLVKEAVIKALQTVEVTTEGGRKAKGAVPYLRWLARTEPKAFATLVGKVMPTQITGEDGKAISIIVNGTDANLL